MRGGSKRQVHRVNDRPRIGLRHGVSSSHQRIVDHRAMAVNPYRARRVRPDRRLLEGARMDG